MDLLDRYLAAIRPNLPESKAADIIAELKDALLAQREDREAQLGRPLTREEMGDLIKAFGHPLVVAGRYQKHQYLIGPELYPFYVATVKTVVSIVFAIQIAIAAINVFVSAGDPSQVVPRTLSQLWTAGIGVVGALTITFFLMERSGMPAVRMERWHPRQLPPVMDRPEKRWEAVVELAFGAIFILWWTGVIRFPPFVPGYDGQGLLALGTLVWTTFYWPILAVAGLGMLSSLIALAQPNRLALRALLIAASTMVSLVVLALIYRALQGTDIGLDKPIGVVVLIIAVLSVFGAIVRIGRLWRARRLSTPPALG